MSEIPEDLKADYQDAKAALEYGQCADPTRFEKEIRVIERIARAETGLDMAVAENHEIAEANATLRAKVAALEAALGPVTPKEAEALNIATYYSMGDALDQRVIPLIDRMIAARARQPSPQEKCVCGHPHRPDGSCTVCVSCIHTPCTSPQEKEQG